MTTTTYYRDGQLDYRRTIVSHLAGRVPFYIGYASFVVKYRKLPDLS